MNRLVVALLSLLGLCSCGGHKDLSVEEFYQKLYSDGAVQLLDVRTPDEFAEGRIPGAVNLDCQAEGFIEAAQASLDPSCPVLVYCRSGRRSAAAASALESAGFQAFNLEGGIVAWEAEQMPVTTYEVERFCTRSGAPVEIWLIKHGSLAIAYKSYSIQVDPVIKLGKVTDYAADFPGANFVLVTHEHGDHFDPEALDILGGDVYTNESCAQLMSEAMMMRPATVIAIGHGASLAEDIELEAVPAYNYTEGHTQFHPKGRCDNGYILTIDGLRIYIAGDTEDIPEMADIKDIDVAFLPCNQPYTMTVEQLINAAKVIQPKVLIPYHFGQTDLFGVPEALPGIDVRLRQMQ